jgi:hypothetical protein
MPMACGLTTPQRPVVRAAADAVHAGLQDDELYGDCR